MFFINWRLWSLVFLFFAIAIGAGFYTLAPAHSAPVVAVAATYKTPEEADPYVRFVMEAFDSIQKNYWQKSTDPDLANVFALSIQKASNGTTTPVAKDRASTAQALMAVLKSLPDAAKKDLVVNTVIVALYNLPPVGRNGLLSKVQETQLRQEVSNINPTKDLYADVGASKGATPEEVKAAYQEKKTQLEKATSTEAKAQLAQAAYAADVLSKEDTKARYDEAKIEPTIFTHIAGTTLYVYISQMAPTTLDEFVKVVKDADSNKNLDSMIIDMRGNIGGSLDIAPYFIGLFMGQNQYAFDLFHQGDYDVIRSPIAKLDSLAKYGDIAILTDNMTQSTAEVITSALKRFHIAHSVGTASRGWGTVENTFPLTTTVDASTTYTMLLVHSITLRDDNQPIEGRGVDADINTTNPDWKSQLSKFFHSSSLISALRDEATRPPVKK